MLGRLVRFALGRIGYELTNIKIDVGYVRECPLCGYTGHFDKEGYHTRVDARCRRCGSLERHRLLALWLNRNMSQVKDAKTLHFAPESCLVSKLEQLSSVYDTADLYVPSVALKVDIEQMSFEEGVYDMIVCFHILEHVDDSRALAEMYRVLSPGGVALITTPVVEGWDLTYEDDTITSAQERRLHFGQGDHVRMFGSDIRARIEAAGFELSEVCGSGKECVQYGLWPGEKLFIARKPKTEKGRP